MLTPSSSSSPPYHRHHHCHDHIHHQPLFINVSVITMSLPMTKTNMTSTMITIVSPTTYDPRSYICSHALGLVRTSSCFYCAGRPDRHQHPNRPSNSFALDTPTAQPRPSRVAVHKQAQAAHHPRPPRPPPPPSSFSLSSLPLFFTSPPTPQLTSLPSSATAHLLHLAAKAPLPAAQAPARKATES